MKLNVLVFAAAVLCMTTLIAAEEGVQRLNNMVRALPVAQMTQDAQLKASFTVPDAGWTFVEFSAPVRQMSLKCCGKIVAGEENMVRSREFMLELPSGEYTVAALPREEAPLKILRVHRIPNIYYYAPANVGGLEVLDGKEHWKQIGGQLLSSTNLLAPAALRQEEVAAYRLAGRRTMFNVMSRPVSEGKPEEFAESITPKMSQEQWDGCTVDEFDFRAPEQYAKYGEALRLVGDIGGKRLYTWCYAVRFEDKPGQREFLDILRSPLNGKGLLLTEVYLETKETEEEADAYIRKRLVDDTASILRTLPEMAPSYGVIPGIFNAMPVLTQETVPEADYKYYLDRQLYVIANDPSFRDLGLVGYWGGNYCQEELQRWCLLLLRHYFVEGNHEMLSPDYGFKYNPDILSNGDFLRDLSSWEATPAENGSIFHDVVKGHGYLMQCRWGKAVSANGDVHNGDSVCVMKRSEKGANTLRQTMRNLVPGRPYQLQFVVGCHDDAVNKKNAPREYGIRAALDSSKVEIRSSGIYVDKRPRHRYLKATDFSRANLHRIVFVPKAAEVALTLTDAESKEAPGTSLMLNFVQVKPYFAPEMLP